MIAHWVRTEGAWLSEPMPQRSGRRLVVACTDDRPCRGFLTWLFEAAPGARSGHSAEPFSYGYWQLRIVDEDREHERLQEKNSGDKRYILHDGPPYANGHIHMGHALNKILNPLGVIVEPD